MNKGMRLLIELYKDGGISRKQFIKSWAYQQSKMSRFENLVTYTGLLGNANHVNK